MVSIPDPPRLFPASGLVNGCCIPGSGYSDTIPPGGFFPLDNRV